MRGGRTTATRHRVAGDVLLHPLALASVALLLLNDHVLKRSFPGVVTGKLSDVAAMVFCPLLIAAGWEVGRRAFGKKSIALPVAGVIVVCGAVAVGFAAMKLNTHVADVYGDLVGAVRSLGGGGVRRVRIAPDPTDAVVSLFVILSGATLIKRGKYDLRERRV